MAALKKLHENGLKTWISIEPYPTPNIDETSVDIEDLLKHIGFVDKIVFGRMNYNKEANGFPSDRLQKRYPNQDDQNGQQYPDRSGDIRQDIFRFHSVIPRSKFSSQERVKDL